MGLPPRTIASERAHLVGQALTSPVLLKAAGLWAAGAIRLRKAGSAY